MTRAEIIGLLAEMVLEDSWHPTVSEDELPYILEELLRAHEYERHWKLNSPIESQSHNQLAQAYAASLSADLSVNNPAAHAARHWHYELPG